jgi:hypothetical protein
MREAKFATKTTPTPLGAYLSKSRLFSNRWLAANDVCGLRAGCFRRSSAAVATSREGHHMPAAFARDLALPVKLNQFGLSIGPSMPPLSILLLGSFSK